MNIKKLKISVLVTVILSWLLVCASQASEIRKNITIAISPCTDVVSIYEKFLPLVEYLQAKTACHIELVFPGNFAEFEKFLQNKNIDFALQDPDVYFKFFRLYNNKSLVISLTTKGEVVESGVVIVRRDSDIHKIEDLVGKSVIFGPKLSSARWVNAKSLFTEKGIDIDKDLIGYTNGGCCEDVAFNVHLKATDAGVVCEHFLAEHEKKQQELGVEMQQIRVIARTKLVSTRVFSARFDVDDTLVSKVNQALLDLDNTNPEHAKILSRAEIGGFRAVRHEDYTGRCIPVDTAKKGK
ncbi:MAG: phosphate/phosphite/phosphonate ABC transporter substrate-binding protein [Pseudomonadota bacterium]